MSPDRQALLSLYHDDATDLLDRALQAQHEPEGLHVVHAAIVEALADAHTNGRPLDVSTTVPDETIAAIEARLDAATPGPWHYDPMKCWRAGSSGAMPIRWGESQEAVFSPTPDGAPTIALTGPANDPQSMADADLIAHAPEDLRALLTEVRRLTDANTRLTDLVRHQRGDLHTAGLITDAEYAALAGLTGSPARLEGYDALRGELALQKRATNVAIGERDEAQTALQNSERTAATLREHHTRRLGIADPETTWGDIIEAARLDGARVMREAAAVSLESAVWTTDTRFSRVQAEEVAAIRASTSAPSSGAGREAAPIRTDRCRARRVCAGCPARHGLDHAYAHRRHRRLAPLIDARPARQARAGGASPAVSRVRVSTRGRERVVSAPEPTAEHVRLAREALPVDATPGQVNRVARASPPPKRVGSSGAAPPKTPAPTARAGVINPTGRARAVANARSLDEPRDPRPAHRPARSARR